MVGVTGSIPVLPTSYAVRWHGLLREHTVRAAISLSLFVCFACSGPLFASVAGTSAGVTTTGGNSTDPSAEVQQQSSGFVQQNQQPNAPKPGATTAILGAPPQAGQAGASGAQNGNKANATIVNGVPVAVTPAAPPPPPPMYESAMHRIERHSDATPTVIASGPPGAVRKQEPAKAAEPTPMPTPAPAPAVKPNTVTPARTDVLPTPAERVVAPPVVGGGRGEAPDGLTFYSGTAIAGALLAFAFATYLRMGRSET
jgi:hypothetical protein